MKKVNFLLTLAFTLLLINSINAQDFSKYSPSSEYISTSYRYSNGAISGISYFAYFKKDKGGLGSVTASTTKSGNYTGTITTGEIIKVTLEFNISLWPTALGNDYTEFQLDLLSSGRIDNYLYRVYPIFAIQTNGWNKFILDTCTSIAIEKWQPTAVEETERQTFPKSFSLSQNYPNPFNPTTKILYSIKEDNYVKLKVYNLIGEEVKILVDGRQKSGEYSVEFTAHNLPGGFYFYIIQAGNSYQAARKMIILK